MQKHDDVIKKFIEIEIIIFCIFFIYLDEYSHHIHEDIMLKIRFFYKIKKRIVIVSN